MKKVLKLFLVMFKIGLFTFGGGYGMIALLENEFVAKRKLIEHEEFMNMLAIAESTPGPIAINSATYLGYKLGKFWGSLFATIGVVLPSFIIIFVLSLFFDKFLSIEWVADAFKGIQVCVVFLILSAGIKMFKKSEKKVINYIIMSIVFVCMIIFSILSIKFSSIFYILISALLGLVLGIMAKVREKKDVSSEVEE